ncbi:hypothetical protein [Streptomyces silvisoli]|uniref:Uncharacterized protein n=1 Tax=Streptomyces silvisoli TaxID=3034235 RepID=A0ABT5ZWD6_9ACTN|nr:hypothetical protein [Streptomyces silvisoli]MDF3294137.1 hypothetical protein [Streptomyces silvisoli]
MSRPEPVAAPQLAFPAAYLQYWVQFPPTDAVHLWREDLEEFIEAHADDPLAATDDGQPYPHAQPAQYMLRVLYADRPQDSYEHYALL